MLCQSTLGFMCLKTIALLRLKTCFVLHDNSVKYFVLHTVHCKCSCLHASICPLLTELLITHPLSPQHFSDILGTSVKVKEYEAWVRLCEHSLLNTKWVLINGEFH